MEKPLLSHVDWHLAGVMAESVKENPVRARAPPSTTQPAADQLPVGAAAAAAEVCEAGAAEEDCWIRTCEVVTAAEAMDDEEAEEAATAGVETTDATELTTEEDATLLAEETALETTAELEEGTEATELETGVEPAAN